MARLAQHTLDGPTGRMNPRTRMVEFGPPPAVQRFAADDDLRAQIAAMKRQIQAALRRAEVAETQLSRLRQSAPAVSPATTPADAFAMMAGRIYSERRMSAPETAPEPPQRQAAIDSEAIYARRRM